MTLARHEPCQLLTFIVPQSPGRYWTLTIRLPYAHAILGQKLPSILKNKKKISTIISYALPHPGLKKVISLAIHRELWYNTGGKET